MPLHQQTVATNQTVGCLCVNILFKIFVIFKLENRETFLLNSHAISFYQIKTEDQ